MLITYEKFVNGSWEEKQSEISIDAPYTKSKFIAELLKINHQAPIRGSITLPDSSVIDFDLNTPAQTASFFGSKVVYGNINHQ